MAYNNRENRQSGGNNFGNRQMFKAVCSECRKDCEIPFKPSGDRPVFCSSCFEKKRGGSSPRRPDDRNFSRPRFEGNNNSAPQDNEQLNMINAKLDKILGLLTPAPVAKVEEPVAKVEKKKRASKK